jgi:hypothetical protein
LFPNSALSVSSVAKNSDGQELSQDVEAGVRKKTFRVELYAE